MRIKIYPYKQGSKSAKALALAIKGRVLKHVGSVFKPRPSDVIVNWGSSSCPVFQPATTLNANVEQAQNKLTAFKIMRDAGVCVPPFWEKMDEVPDDVFPVMCRTLLSGHSGAGIVVATDAATLVPAPLYTQYIKKKHEYRVHIFNDKAFFVQRKARKLSIYDPNWMIRNLEGGFVFVEAEFSDVPPAVVEQSIMAIKSLGLNFGGVDVMWNAHDQQAYVLEVNTACGLEERTANKYAQAIGEGL